MVRHSVYRWPMALLALAWAGTANAAASPLFVTGNVATDMPAPAQGTTNGITIIPGQAENAVAQPAWMTNAGLINGNVIQDVRLSYDAKSDTLSVGVNFYGIAGDTDGSKDGLTNPLTTAAGGSNTPHLGGDKSITIAFTSNIGTTANPLAAADPTVVAGVPANKSVSPAGTLDGFDVATVNKSALGGGIAQAYGTTLTSNLGQLAYDPSSAHPGFEFTIANFSKIPGLSTALTQGFYVSAYAGTGSNIIVGKGSVADTFVGAPLGEPQKLVNPPTVTPPAPPASTPPIHPTPEPTTILAWGLVAGGAGWRVRRRIRRPVAV